MGGEQAVVHSVAVQDCCLGSGCEVVDKTAELLAAVELPCLLFLLNLGKTVDEHEIRCATSLLEYLISDDVDERGQLAQVSEFKRHECLLDLFGIVFLTVATAQQDRFDSILDTQFHAIDHEGCLTRVGSP